MTALALQKYQPSNLSELQSFAQTVVRSKLCGVQSPEDALLIMMTGAELGLTAMQSLRGIHVVSGKPVLSADMLGAVVSRSPECKYLRVVEMSAERCIVETLREGHPEPVRMEWTLEDAKRAGLLRSPTWSKYPQAMLKARTMAQLCRAVYPDLCLGLYTPDEMGAEETIEEAHVVELHGSVEDAHQTLVDAVHELVEEPVAVAFLEMLEEHYGVSTLLELPTPKLQRMAAELTEERIRRAVAPEPPTVYSKDEKYGEKWKKCNAIIRAMLSRADLTDDQQAMVLDHYKARLGVESLTHIHPRLMQGIITDLQHRANPGIEELVTELEAAKGES